MRHKWAPRGPKGPPVASGCLWDTHRPREEGPPTTCSFLRLFKGVVGGPRALRRCGGGGPPNPGGRALETSVGPPREAPGCLRSFSWNRQDGSNQSPSNQRVSFSVSVLASFCPFLLLSLPLTCSDMNSTRQTRPPIFASLLSPSLPLW